MNLKLEFKILVKFGQSENNADNDDNDKWK